MVASFNTTILFYLFFILYLTLDLINHFIEIIKRILYKNSINRCPYLSIQIFDCLRCTYIITSAL